jgi:hypothetical protein
MKTLVLSLFLTLVATAVAVDVGGVENEMAATSTVTSPHAHIRSAIDGIFNEMGDEEVTPFSSCGSINQINDPSIGKRCRTVRDCGTLYPRCGNLICVKNSPNDLYGKCARAPKCHEEGDTCEEDYECCASFKCDGYSCIRETNEGYCRPKDDSCNDDFQCCGVQACVRARCSGLTTTCKKPGGYCEEDYECCDALECGVSHHCVIVDSKCKAQGEDCNGFHIAEPEVDPDEYPFQPEDCCDGLQCKDSQCIQAGRSQCKLQNSYCDRSTQCCGDLICSDNFCIKPEPGDTECTDLGEFCGERGCCADMTCGPSFRCVKDCVGVGRRCAKTADCCGGLNCRSNQCVRVERPIIDDPPNDGCVGRRCARTADCCGGLNCRSNQCR